MKLVFLSNYFNHHQKPFCESMFKILGDEFCFISTSAIPEWRKELGYSELSAEYVIQYDSSLDGIIDQSDSLIIGSAPFSLVKRRLKNNKITFFYSERIYKEGIPWFKIPKHILTNYFSFGRYKNLYMLSASAFCPYDYSLSLSFLGKCFKWGYFPETKKYQDINNILSAKSGNSELQSQKISILWVGRIIEWKHPEAVLYLADRLRQENFSFHITMVGTGDLAETIRNQIIDEGFEKDISLIGAVSPMAVRNYMEKSDIFIFTSDQREGWGAVLNESMNSACAVVASDAIGSVPYLINNGKNGLVFKSTDWNDLYSNVKYLIINPMKRCTISRAAYQTISDHWNAEIAARNFLKLVAAINQGSPSPFEEGPCSIAPIIRGY